MTKTNELKAALAAKGLKYVGTRGNLAGPVCFVGESPGADEDQAGVPFVGASGRELDKLISESGFDTSGCWWTNPYKTRPPDNKIDRLGELGVDLQLFRDQFFEELNAYKPTFIIPLGATPLGILCPVTLGKRTGHAEISKWRGSILRSESLQWDHYILPNFHPAFLFRAWEERAVALLVFGKAFEEYEYWRQHGRLQPLPERQLISDPPADTAIDFLRGLLSTPQTPVSIDIENIGVYRGKYKTPERNRLPYVIGFSNNPLIGMSIGLSEYEKPKIQQIWKLINQVLGQLRIIGQNYYTHDGPWLEYIGFNNGIKRLDDTRLRHHVLWPELSHKLEFMAMQYTREPYYKEEGKNWTVKECQLLKRYNCKDVCVTLEVFNEQEKEFNQRPSLKRFYYDYEMPLARAFFEINKRGIATDSRRLSDLRSYCTSELERSCSEISKIVGGTRVISQEPTDARGRKIKDADAFNLSSPKQIGEVLKKLGMRLPTKNRGNGVWSESTDEEALQELMSQNKHPILKEILRVRELNKVLGTYVNARLSDDGSLLGCFETAGTVTGRRSCGDNFLGLGTNLQNQPKHSDLGKRFRECLVSRHGKIFVACDQVSAEDWIVQGIIADQSGDRRGLEELLQGVDRHRKLASFIFNKPEALCGKDANHSDTPERFMGKKTRHAGNYDMEAFRFSMEMIKEGHIVDQNFCQWLLDRFHAHDPGIKQVFHKYIQNELIAKRTLTNLFGRERQFFALRDYADNKKIMKEGYAQIPQGTIGDNTGMSILWLETHHPGYVILDVHDAVYLEVSDNVQSVFEAICWLQKSFDRVIRFPRGLEIKIPVEFEIGYSLGKMKSCDDLSEAGLTNTYLGLNRPVKAHVSITSGAPRPSSEPSANAACG